MDITELELPGVFFIQPHQKHDTRGFFMRSYCQATFEKYGMNTRWRQSNLSFNENALTLRGMHYHAKLDTEIKLVQCLSGKVCDVVVDLRPQSPTYKQHAMCMLENCQSLYVPAGFAHGFLTLTDNVLLSYLMSSDYEPEAARGVAWDDPVLEIPWPKMPEHLSDADKNHSRLG